MPLSVETLRANLEAQLSEDGYTSYSSVPHPWASAYHQYASEAVTGGSAQGKPAGDPSLIEAAITSYGNDVFPDQLAAGIVAYWLGMPAWPPNNGSYNPGTTTLAPPTLAAELRSVLMKNVTSAASRSDALREIAQVLHTYTTTEVKVTFTARRGGGISVESPA